MRVTPVWKGGGTVRLTILDSTFNAAFSFEDKKRRELAVTFTAKTIYGEINITKGVQI